MTIETRPLGRTGADVTILGYGAMELRGQPRGPAIADEDAGQLLGAVLDSGINLIDTSKVSSLVRQNACSIRVAVGSH
jgi:aryl-alcohol dehydrogenase-like predicted oxidoreductase